jgi:hypothetical protein
MTETLPSRFRTKRRGLYCALPDQRLEKRAGQAKDKMSRR